MAYTEVTSTSWISRLGGAFKGILVGIVLVVVACGLLFWNEGRAVKRAKDLAEGAGAVISVSASEMQSANEGQLVHMTGLATSDQTLSDTMFPVSATAIKLRRTVEMYQWQENTKSETRKKLGGGEETVTTYTYGKVWSESAINSSSFKESGHDNPGMQYNSEEQVADNVALGQFVLSNSLVSQMSNYEDLPITTPPSSFQGLPSNTKVNGGGYYIGYYPNSPAIGDYRITYQIVNPATVSIVSVQKGNSFAPYKGSRGSTIDELVLGEKTADEMFTALEAQNKMMTWILRAVGFIVMFIGFRMIFGPISVVLDVLPFLGNIAGAGISLISFILTLILAPIVVAIAWLRYRPIIGLAVLAIAVVGIVMLIRARKKGKNAAAGIPAAPSAPPSAPPPPPGE